MFPHRLARANKTASFALAKLAEKQQQTRPVFLLAEAESAITKQRSHGDQEQESSVGGVGNCVTRRGYGRAEHADIVDLEARAKSVHKVHRGDLRTSGGGEVQIDEWLSRILAVVRIAK